MLSQIELYLFYVINMHCYIKWLNVYLPINYIYMSFIYIYKCI